MLLKSDLVLAQMNVGFSARKKVKSVLNKRQQADEESVREGNEEDEQT